MSIAFWQEFFQAAGIPRHDAQDYAILFEENRIAESMLGDLRKEHLADMGIRKMGDIIGILKCAGERCLSQQKSRLLEQQQQPEQQPQQLRTSAGPSSRIVEHPSLSSAAADVAGTSRSLKRAAPLDESRRDATGAGAKSQADPPPPPPPPQPSKAKERVFNRLGGDPNDRRGQEAANKKASVFNRLSGGGRTVVAAAAEPASKPTVIRPIRFDERTKGNADEDDNTRPSLPKKPLRVVDRWPDRDDGDSKGPALQYRGVLKLPSHGVGSSARSQQQDVRKAEAHSTVDELVGPTLYSDGAGYEDHRHRRHDDDKDRRAAQQRQHERQIARAVAAAVAEDEADDDLKDRRSRRDGGGSSSHVRVSSSSLRHPMSSSTSGLTRTVVNRPGR